MHVRCHIAAEHGTREEVQAYEPQKPRIMERHDVMVGNQSCKEILSGSARVTRGHDRCVGDIFDMRKGQCLRGRHEGDTESHPQPQRLDMKKRFPEEQIIDFLREAS
ncbi:MAG: hypothetical protein WAM90_00545 [Rhodanobacter sp.]